MKTYILREAEWDELSPNDDNLYASEVHSNSFVFKIENNLSGDDQTFEVKELLLADFTADNAQYDLTSFTKIDHQTYSLAFPDTFYKFSTLTLRVTVARGNDGSEITNEYQIKTMSGKTPEDATVSDTPMIACPAII